MSVKAGQAHIGTQISTGGCVLSLTAFLSELLRAARPGEPASPLSPLACDRRSRADLAGVPGSRGTSARASVRHSKADGGLPTPTAGQQRAGACSAIRQGFLSLPTLPRVYFSSLT